MSELFSKWDSICARCGLCCYEKHHTYRKPGHHRTVPSVSPRFYIDLTEPCCFLDEKTRQCTVYQYRFKACRNCGRLTIFHALFAGYLPAECAYVKKFQKWRKIFRHK